MDRHKLVHNDRPAVGGKVMASLRFVGVDPNTPDTGSPTVWVDDENGDIIIQGWKIDDEATLRQIMANGPIPGHETVIRLPRRMAAMLMEAAHG
jgi:hypothetical protein